jgi:hypothetical protein
MSEANFEIVDYMTTTDVLVIRDLDNSRTITNDAKNVVEKLAAQGLLPDGRRLFYFDTMGRLDEIVVEHGQFKCFSPLPQHKHA